MELLRKTASEKSVRAAAIPESCAPLRSDADRSVLNCADFCVISPPLARSAITPSRKSASYKLALTRMAPRSKAPRKSAFVRLASLKFARSRLAPKKTAPLRLALDRLQLL